MKQRAEEVVEEYRQSVLTSGKKKDLVNLIEQALTLVYLETRSLILDPIPCPEHPQYGGKRKPRTLCEGCWGYFIQRKR